jgi:sterol desaturase/sphingolipid hydroxylase (fatty acid hydroxylase superfamily)
MDGIKVGNRVFGAQSPVTIGWENLPKVEGGAVKVFIFTYFQPAVLFALIAYFYWAPSAWVKPSTVLYVGIGFKALLLMLEWVSPRFKSWQLTWKELVVDLFYVGLGYTLINIVAHYIGSDVMTKAIQHYFHQDQWAWFIAMPVLLQALLLSVINDFRSYWMHRGMHNWYPLWLPHSVHHYITQLNINKGAVGNPVEIFLIGLGVGGFFDFLPRAVLIAGAVSLAVGTYQHINVRFNTPRWWRFVFNTTEHHSLHHSQDYESTRCNYAGTYILWDRIMGTCVDGEAELLGQEGGRRMSIREQMTHPFTEGARTFNERFGRRPVAMPAE